MSRWQSVRAVAIAIKADLIPRQFESFFYGLAGLIVVLAAFYIGTIKFYVGFPLGYVGAGLAITSLVKVRQASKERDISGIPTVGIVFAVFALLAFVPFGLVVIFGLVFGFGIGW